MGLIQRILRGAVGPVRLVVGVNRQSPTNARPGGTLSELAHAGCSRIGRPPRMPSYVAETKEEQQMEVGKARVWRKRIKTIKSRSCIDFDRLDASIGRDPLYL